ncbi:MAG: hypothetical protein M3680_10280 [Myxococcota bacterium]|nr:hypothetical protein [Myxococcota bacterium]
MIVAVTQRTEPRIKQIYDIEGSTGSSRMVADDLYLVQNTSAHLPPRLVWYAVGDSLVSNLTTEMVAREMGMRPGRRPARQFYDEHPEPLPLATNVPPVRDNGTHPGVNRNPAALRQVVVLHSPVAVDVGLIDDALGAEHRLHVELRAELDIVVAPDQVAVQARCRRRPARTRARPRPSILGGVDALDDLEIRCSCRWHRTERAT